MFRAIACVCLHSLVCVGEDAEELCSLEPHGAVATTLILLKCFTARAPSENVPTPPQEFSTHCLKNIGLVVWKYLNGQIWRGDGKGLYETP